MQSDLIHLYANVCLAKMIGFVFSGMTTKRYLLFRLHLFLSIKSKVN